LVPDNSLQEPSPLLLLMKITFLSDTPFVLDIPMSSNDVDISCDGLRMMHTDSSELDVDEHINISGTTSSHTLNNIIYWEVRSSFFMGRLGTDGDTAFEIGICDFDKADNIPEVKKNYSSYICCAVRRGNSVFLEYYREGKTTHSSTPLKWKKPFNIHLGFFFNPTKKSFSVIDIDNGKVLIVFNEIKQKYKYVAIFDTGNSEGRTQLKMELFTGDNIKTVPEIVYKELL